MVGFNFFFLPPVGTLTIADPQNWVALFAFLAVSLVASNLSAAVRARAQEAQSRRDELTRLFDLSRDVLVMTDSQALSVLARSVATRFALGLRRHRPAERRQLGVSSSRRRCRSRSQGGFAGAHVCAASRERSQFDARERTYGGHATQVVDGETVRIVPLRVGTQADRPAGGGGTADRAGNTRRARGHCRDRHRARAVPRGSQDRRAHAPERGTEDRAAGLARPRSADAADGDPGRRRRICRRPGSPRRTAAIRRM